MPFKITELGDFKNVRTLAAGSAILLADGEENTAVEVAPFMVLGLMGSAPASPMIAAGLPNRPPPHSGRARGPDDDVRGDPHRRHAGL